MGSVLPHRDDPFVEQLLQLRDVEHRLGGRVRLHGQFSGRVSVINRRLHEARGCGQPGRREELFRPLDEVKRLLTVVIEVERRDLMVTEA